MMERAFSAEVWRETRAADARRCRSCTSARRAAVIVSTLITLAGPALVRYAVDHGIVEERPASAQRRGARASSGSRC